METNVFEFRPAGYAYILKKLELSGMPNWHTSSVSTTGTSTAFRAKASAFCADFILDWHTSTMKTSCVSCRELVYGDSRPRTQVPLSLFRRSS
jgi:hypothetical protein